MSDQGWSAFISRVLIAACREDSVPPRGASGRPCTVGYYCAAVKRRRVGSSRPRIGSTEEQKSRRGHEHLEHLSRRRTRSGEGERSLGVSRHSGAGVGAVREICGTAARLISSWSGSRGSSAIEPAIRDPRTHRPHAKFTARSQRNAPECVHTTGDRQGGSGTRSGSSQILPRASQCGWRCDIAKTESPPAWQPPSGPECRTG